jgi:hypothetical protein
VVTVSETNWAVILELNGQFGVSARIGDHFAESLTS